MRNLPIHGFILAIVAIAAVFLPHPSRAEIIVRENTKYFSVDGENGRELSRSMVAGTAGRLSLRHALAATEARYGIGNADIGLRNGRCVVNRVQVLLDVTYHLPRWTGESRANARLRAAWQRFHAELVRHEREHGRIAREGAAELEKVLLRLSGTVAFKCNDFGAFAAARLTWLASKIEQRQSAFDRRENSRSSRISRLQIELISMK